MLLIDTRRRAWHSLSCCGTQIGPFTRPFMVYYFRLWVAPYPRQRTGTRPRIKSYAISPRRCEFPAYCDHQKSRARQFPVSTRRPLYLWPWTRRSQGTTYSPGPTHSGFPRHRRRCQKIPPTSPSPGIAQHAHGGPDRRPSLFIYAARCRLIPSVYVSPRRTRISSGFLSSR